MIKKRLEESNEKLTRIHESVLKNKPLKLYWWKAEEIAEKEMKPNHITKWTKMNDENK
jgi:hypothetical protein